MTPSPNSLLLREESFLSSLFFLGECSGDATCALHRVSSEPQHFVDVSNWQQEHEEKEGRFRPTSADVGDGFGSCCILGDMEGRKGRDGTFPYGIMKLLGRYDAPGPVSGVANRRAS